MTQRLKELIIEYRASGRVAFVHPKRKAVSFNGFQQLNYEKALAYLEKWDSERKAKQQKDI